ncbi:hypothetical protein Nepgr_009337 [Nepenthes gracilis]|uniref:Uncharacterized protein n=1 Tax=Nepenthes gracilis TaxID=150966 RepID=A0AAD3XK25_NEPGR|nr:hypothetical protein Nepgr_009337 [Nepenthes gracilis]
MLFTISDCLKNLLSLSDVRSEWDNRSWVAVPSSAPIPISFGSRSLGAQFQWHPLLSPISKIGLSGRDEMAKQLVHGGRPRQPDILDLVSKQKFITRSTTEDGNGLMTPHPFLETRPLVGLGPSPSDEIGPVGAFPPLASVAASLPDDDVAPDVVSKRCSVPPTILVQAPSSAPEKSVALLPKSWADIVSKDSMDAARVNYSSVYGGSHSLLVDSGVPKRHKFAVVRSAQASFICCRPE